MSLKKIKILNVVVAFGLSFLVHQMYTWFPNIITSIFSPVNESIWEHMKIFATVFCFYGIIEYFILRKSNISTDNYLISLLICIVVGIIAYLIIFIPLHLWFSRAMWVALTLMFIVYVLMNVISYYIIKAKTIRYGNIIGIVGIVLIYVLFTYLTYAAPHNFIFFDTEDEKYGVSDYLH